jgi:hypothetical protein
MAQRMQVGLYNVIPAGIQLYKAKVGPTCTRPTWHLSHSARSRGRSSATRSRRTPCCAWTPRCDSEKDAELAQKSGQLQPFVAVFPLASFGPTCIFWVNLTPFSLMRLELPGPTSHRTQDWRFPFNLPTRGPVVSKRIVGLGRIVASNIEAPNPLANLGSSG